MALIDATSVIRAVVALTGGKMRENCHICNSNPKDVIFIDLKFMNRDKSTINSFIMFSFRFCVQGPRYEVILTLYEVTSVSFSYLITSFLSLHG